MNELHVQFGCVKVFVSASYLLESLERVDSGKICTVVEVELRVSALRVVELELRELLRVVFVGLIVEQAQLCAAGAQDEQEAVAVVGRQAIEVNPQVAGIENRQPREVREELDFVFDADEIFHRMQSPFQQ